MAGPFVAPEAAPKAAPGPQVFQPEAGKVAIKDLDGSVSKIAAGDLAKAATEGAVPATEAEYFGAREGLAGKGLAGLAGTARGVSMGFSDPLYIDSARILGGQEAADSVRRGLNLTKEAHPTISAGSEVAGALAALAVGAPPAEGAIAAETFFGRAVARGAAALPRASAEGVLMGVGQHSSEDALQNRPFVAESYTSAALEGGLIGALLGVTTTAGVGALSDRFAPRFGRAVESAAVRQEAAAVGAEARQGSGLLGKLQEQGDVAAYRAAGAGKSEFRRLGMTVEEQTEQAARLGRRVQESVEKSGETFATTSQKRIAEIVTKEANEAGAELGTMRKALDAQAFERPSVRTIAQRFQGEVMPAIRDSHPLGVVDELARAEKIIQRMGEAADADGRIGFQQLHSMRKEIEKGVSYSRIPGTAEPVGDAAQKALRSIVEDEFVRAAEKGSKEVGQEFASKYALAKERYADFKALKDMATSKAAGQAASSSTFQLKDMLFGAAGASLHPAGLLAPVAGKLAREYGNQVAAHAISKFSKLRAAQSAAESLDRALESGAKGLFSGARSKVAEKSLTSAEVRAIRQAVSTPEVIEAQIQKAIAPIAKDAPKLAAAVAANMTRAAVHMRDSLPRDPVPAGMPLQTRPPPPMSGADLRKAAQMIETVDDPAIVLERMKQGRLTETHVRTLEAVHPETYLKMQTYLQNHASELRRTLTVQEEIKLSLLFRRPLSPTMQPSNVAAFQAVFLPPPEMEPKQGVGSNVANVSAEAGGTRATQWDEQEKNL